MKNEPLIDILNNYCQIENPTQSGLLLLDLPTGFGKTYAVQKYIADNYQKTDKKIIYITDLKKNLDFEEMKRKFFESEIEKENFDKNFIFIDSNVDFVIKNFDTCYKKMPDDIKYHQACINLQAGINAYEGVKSNKTVQDKFKNIIFKEYEPKFRKLIDSKLKDFFIKDKISRGSQPEAIKIRLQKIRNEKRFSWLINLYPAIESSEKKVFFMSVDKFMLKNSTLIQPSYDFIDKKFLNNALIFIDEFDKSKSILLKKIIENQLEKRIDLISLARHFYSQFTALALPADLKLTSNIEELKNRINQLNAKHNLEYSFKTKNDADAKRFLFHNHQYYTVDDKFVHLSFDKEKQTNYIEFIDDKKTDSPNILNLIGDIQNYISFFIAQARIIARKLADDKNAKKAGTDVEYSFENGLNSFFNQLHLNDEQKQYLTARVSSQNFTHSKKQQSIFQGCFYTDGFRYYQFEDNDNHATLSKISTINFDTTPEKILLNLAQNNMVVGISATAKIKSVIANYDIDFLKANLDKCYYELAPEDLEKLKNKFSEQTKNYKEIDIQRPHFISVDDAKQELYQLLNHDEECANEIWTDIESNTKSTDRHIHKRYVRIANAFDIFFQAKHIYSFVCFLNIHPKEKDKNLDKNILKHLFSAIMQKHGDNITKVDDIFDILKTEQDFESRKNGILKKLAQGQRLFLITAYQTLGAGQNIQYQIPDNMNCVELFKRESIKEKDFDGIYLDRPTHVLVNTYDGSKLEEFDINKHLFNLHFLNQVRILSRDTLKTKVKIILSQGEEKADKTYAKKHYHNAVAKTVIQAIGRLNRTNHKNKEILIVVDEEIKQSLAYFQDDTMIHLKEFDKLLADCQKSDVAIHNQNELIEELHNEWSNINDYCYAEIQRMLNFIHSDWQNKNEIKQWQALRQFVLKYPTLSIEQFNSYIETDLTQNIWQKIYIPLEDNANALSYHQEDDYKTVKLNTGNYRVSDISLKQLMQLDVLREYFIQQGYALTFQKNNYILAPIIFNNIYKGALGEVIGKCLLENKGVQLSELPEEIFEKFDYCNQTNEVFIDFKHWHNERVNNREREADMDNICKKIAFIKEKGFNFKRLLLINTLAEENSDIENMTYSVDKSIVTVRYLIKQKSLTICEDTLFEIAKLCQGME